MKVCYIFRVEHPSRNSIENVFRTVEASVREQGVETQRYVRNASLWKTLQEIRSIDADVFHITGDIYYLALFLPRRKTTLTVHDIGSYKYGMKGLKRYVFALIWFVLPILKLKKITVISEKVKQDLMHCFHISASKIEVIENPLSLELSFVPKASLSQKPAILQIGSGPHKNLPGLLEAVQGLYCRLLIIGEPGAQLVEKMERDAIDFTIYNRISNEKVKDLYAEADIIFFASFNEGFGLPIIEGQAIGRAVITSNLSPMKEVAGDAALLVDPNDTKAIRQAIETLISNPREYHELVERGSANVSRYTPSFIASKYVDFYASYFNESVN